MDYYHDIEVNFHSENINYYEWLNTDKIVLIKKIPFFYISSETFIKIYKNKIKISSDLYNKIKQKTIINNHAYTCMLICDKSNTMVIKFDNNCIETSRSNLTYADDENVCEFIYSIPKKKIEFVVVEPIKMISNRHLLYLKEKVNSILKQAYEGNSNKLDYLYLELINESNKSIDLEYKELVQYINDSKDLNTLIKVMVYE